MSINRTSIVHLTCYFRKALDSKLALGSIWLTCTMWNIGAKHALDLIKCSMSLSSGKTLLFIDIRHAIVSFGIILFYSFVTINSVLLVPLSSAPKNDLRKKRIGEFLYGDKISGCKSISKKKCPGLLSNNDSLTNNPALIWINNNNFIFKGLIKCHPVDKSNEICNILWVRKLSLSD